MALDGDRLGIAMAAALNSVSFPADQPISNAKREEIWKAVGAEIVKEFKDNGLVTVSSDGATAAHAPGSPAPIISLPGTGSIA